MQDISRDSHQFGKNWIKYSAQPVLPVSGSVVTAAVKPTPDEPRPVVGMARGAEWRTYLGETNLINSHYNSSKQLHRDTCQN